MCGIVAGLSFGKLNKRDEDIRQRLLRYFTTELLIATEDRGKDATGAVVLFEDGHFIGLKRGEQVTDFLATFGESKEYYGSLLKVWRDHESNCKVYIGHCRAATIGDKADNENNHPIKIGNLVGAHNGSIKNHDKIFKNLGCSRDGKVDSEAIFRMLSHFTNGGKEPFTTEVIQNVVDRLEGQFAVVAFNADNVEQVPMFRDGRPIELVLIRPYGILLALSDKKFWNRLHFRYERWVYYYREMYGVKLPTFTGKDDIETKDMPDDHALIFDLSKKVTKKTKIEDLCEKKKMGRGNKIWRETITTTYPTRTTSFVTSNKKEDKDSKKKRRVFDKINKNFLIKEGDKVLKDEESATLSIDKASTDKADGKDNKSGNSGSETISSQVTVINKRKLSRELLSPTDDEEDKSSAALEMEDHTSYNVKDDKDDVIDVSPEDIKEVKEPEIVEVMMQSFPQEAIKAASRANKDIPEDKKGYGSMEELLTDIEVKDKERAEGLGILLVANRVAQAKWVSGFMAGYSVRMKEKENEDDEDSTPKSKKREDHIAGLKSLSLLLARFYDKSKTVGNVEWNENVENKLAQITLDDNKKLNIAMLISIFNRHERKMLKGVAEVISQADQYKGKSV